jgi:hypothetical protein
MSVKRWKEKNISFFYFYYAFCDLSLCAILGSDFFFADIFIFLNMKWVVFGTFECVTYL